jgi:hypothetical protein
MKPRLDVLNLTDETRDAAEKEIEKLAYSKWEQAGCPTGADLKFWIAAEREWIEYQYTPQRYPKPRTDRRTTGVAV